MHPPLPHPPSSDSSEAEAGLAFLQPHFAKEGFPWVQIWGYIGSLALTWLAYLTVVRHMLAPSVLIAAILAMAVTQAALQLGVFMHLRESRGLAWQILPLGLAFFTALGMIGMSIWIMAFKSGVS